MNIELKPRLDKGAHHGCQTAARGYAGVAEHVTRLGVEQCSGPGDRRDRCRCYSCGLMNRE
jgi:hypothetical protein